MAGPIQAELGWGRGLGPPFGGRSDEHRGAVPSDEGLCPVRSVSKGSLVRPGVSSGRLCAFGNSQTSMFEKAICHVISYASGAGAPP